MSKKKEVEIEFDEKNEELKKKDEELKKKDEEEFKKKKISKNDLETKIISKYIDRVKDRAKYFGGGLLIGSIMNPLTVIIIFFIFAIITNNSNYIQQGFNFGQEIIYKLIMKDRKFH